MCYGVDEIQNDLSGKLTSKDDGAGRGDEG